MPEIPANFNYAFPSEEHTDEEICEALGINTDAWRQVGSMYFKAPQALHRHYATRHLKHVMSFDKGMGKTISYLRAAADQNPDRLLIQCGMNATLTQITHIEKYFPQWADRYVIVSHMDKEKRRKMWESDAKVFISTPATLQADMGGRSLGARGLTARSAPAWLDNPESVIVDEFHKWLRRRKSGYHGLLKRMSPEQLILSSGSAGGKGPQDMWAALHLCDPKLWSAYWRYVFTYCEVSDGEYGKHIGGVKNIAGWRRSISNQVIHRKKDRKDYPPKTRQALPVEVPRWQMQAHNKLRRQLMLELGDGELYVVPNTLAAFQKIRQFMICPKVIDPTMGWGAGLEGMMEDIKDSELSHFVISTPFRAPIPLIKQFLKENGFHAEHLMGGDPDNHVDMRERIERWRQKGGGMIQSIKFAESYELPHANIMYMLGYDSSPEANEQAEDRINRDLRITPKPSDIYYVKCLGSYDERVIEMMSQSADNNYNMLNRPLSEVFDLFGGD